VAEFRHQTRLGKEFESSILVEVDHDGIARLSGTDERHDTVAAGIAVLHDAGVAIDGEGRGRSIHTHTLPTG